MHGGRETSAAATNEQLADAIAASRPGEAAAEEAELYRRFAPRVRLYGIKHLRDDAAAQDLAQQVLLVTIERLRAREVRKTADIASFILGTSRIMADALKRTTRRRERLANRFPVSEPFTEPSGTALDMNDVMRCLQTLAERDRSLLILTFYAEKTAAEIGRELGLSDGAVRVARYRSLERLRVCLGLRLL